MFVSLVFSGVLSSTSAVMIVCSKDYTQHVTLATLSTASRLRAFASVHVRHRACACGALILHVHVSSQSVQLCPRSGRRGIIAGTASSADGGVAAVTSCLRAGTGLDLRGGELLPCLF